MLFFDNTYMRLISLPPLALLLTQPGLYLKMELIMWVISAVCGCR